MRRGNQVVGEQAVFAALDGEERRQFSAAQGPVHRSAEIINVGADRDGQAFDLLGGDVIGRALDARFFRADGAGLAEVDDLHDAVPGQQNIVRFEVAMDEAGLMHRLEGFAGVDEAIDQHRHRAGDALIQRGAIKKLHDQSGFENLAQQGLFGLVVDDLAEVGMRHFSADLKLAFKLLDEPNMLVSFSRNMFQGIDLLCLWMADGVDQAAGAFADRF